MKYIRTLAAALAAGLFTVSTAFTCTASAQAETDTARAKAPKIIATIFPEYDWTRQILGDNPAGADLTLLLDSGVDLHSFQPVAEDILNISSCDLFIYVGGESDEWVDDALAKAVNEDMVVLNLLEILGDSAKEEEVIEGMQADAHGHEHEEDEGHGEAGEHEEDEEHEEHDHDEVEYDEHVWLSLKNAAVFVQAIADALAEVDPANAAFYEENAAAYIEKLHTLDTRYEETVASAGYHTLLFGDRFPFRYLTDDYGLDYFAAFVGCSAETEASFETISFLARKMDELGLPAVMTIEGTDHKIAETVVATTSAKDQKILTMDSMQGTTAKDVENGADYLAIMDANLAVLAEALQ